MRKTFITACRGVYWLGALIFVATCPIAAWAEPLDSIQLQPGATVLQSHTGAVSANGLGSNLFLPHDGLFIFDHAVESGKELSITLITGEQYKQVSTGKKISGKPVWKISIRGEGSQSVSLKKGEYFLFVGRGEKGVSETQISLRVSFQAKQVAR